MTITGSALLRGGLSVARSVSLGAVAAVLALALTGYLGDPPPSGPTDPHFAAVGAAYRAPLAGAYARAWEEGARAIDAGADLPTALSTVGKSWEAGRSRAFDRVLGPELARIVPESQTEPMTPAQRAAMAGAWRGIAAGLSRR